MTRVRSPFVRLAELIGSTPPGASPIALSVGEPQHAVPDFVGPVLAANIADFNKYPAIRGTDAFRAAVAAWIGRRYPGVALDPAREVMILNGSREGLFTTTIAAASYAPVKGRRKVAMPNPFYPPYAASAVAAGAEPLLLPAGRETGFLPDLSAVPAADWDDTIAFFLCSPANPQGVIASRAYLAEALRLARRHGFILFADECYSELYDAAPPPGALEVAAETGSLANLVVFNSLSKRSNLAGLRVGFIAGDAAFLDHLFELRNVTAAQVPLPAQAVAVAAYADEAHVEANRALYRAKFDQAERILGNRFGPVRPPGGFFLWLDVAAHGPDEEVALRLWREGGLRTVPGSYLASPAADGSNPGAGYLRVALVHPDPITGEALSRVARILT
jgi:aspartate/methionine/tyrosine aminotransferase